MIPENPFIFGEIIDDARFVDRTEELSQLVRDLADGQKVFLLSPRRFGKSSLVAVALLKLKKRHIHTVNLTVSSYSSYAQFLEKFAEKVLRAAGPWERVKDWISRFGRQVKPDDGFIIQLKHNLAWVYSNLSRFAEADKMMDGVVACYEARRGPEK